MKLLATLFLLSSLTLFSQEEITSAIKGTVIDKESSSPIPGVKIIIIGSSPVIGTFTDEDGNYRFDKIPIGRIALTFSYSGYNSVDKTNLLLISAKELEINVELEEKITLLNEVRVIAKDNKRGTINEMNTVSARVISTEEAMRFSGTLQDPARMAQNYAGVSGGNDARNDVVVRGNSPTGVLWRMEGVDIPSPNHFSTVGTTGGPVSLLNMNNLKNSEFMTSAWASEYGNALGGVFDLRLRKGNKDKREYLAQIGFNGFEFGLEGPFIKGKDASYMANYRYSTLGVIDAIGIDLGTGTSIPQYQDLTFKMDFKTSKKSRLSIWGIGGISYISFQPDTTISNDSNLFFDENQDAKFESKMGVIGSSYTYIHSIKTSSKFVFAASNTTSIGKIDSVDLYTGASSKITRFNQSISRLTAHYKIKHKVNSKNTIVGGVIGDLYAINFLDSSKVFFQFLERSNYKGQSILGQSYVQWKHKFSQRLVLNSGIHTQHFSSNSHAIEPRVGIRYSLTEKQNISFGTGMHSQIQPIVVYFNKDLVNNTTLPNKNLDFTKSLHFVLAHDLFLGRNTRIKTEVYYQHLYNVPIDTFSSSFSMLNQGADFIISDRTGLKNEGTGANYGFELTLERFFSKGFYYLLSTSFFQSKYKGSDGVYRNTAFNNNYVVNALIGKEIEINPKFTLTFDAHSTIAGGRPYTPINLELSQQYNYEITEVNKAYTENYADYFRLDVKVGFRINGRKTTQEFALDIQNVTNQKNIFLQGYKPSNGTIATTYQRGIFPMVVYKLFF